MDPMVRGCSVALVSGAHSTYRYTSDVVGELFFSRMFGFLDGAYDYGGYIGALDLLTPFVAVACVTPVYLRPLFLLGGAVIPQVSRALAVLKRFESAAELCVDQRRCLLPSCLGTCFTDMLQHFFDIVRDEDTEEDMEKDFGLIEVRREIYGALYVEFHTSTGPSRLTIHSIAGSDTTAAAINAILYHLMRTPSAYAKLQKEIDVAREENKLSENVQYSEAEPLPYLVACCKEGMRLHPSVGMTLPRSVPSGGCMIAGEMFPGGTRVGVNAAVVQRDRRIFGEDADSFVPERWFRADAKRMERYMFVVRNPILLKLPLSLTEIAVWRRSKRMHWEECELARTPYSVPVDEAADIHLRDIKSRRTAAPLVSSHACGSNNRMENENHLVP